jgi:hypothetical protein
MISAAELLPHLNCEVELNTYDDGTIALECNTCCKILMSLKINCADCCIDDDCEPPVIEFNGINGDDVEVVGATFPEMSTDPEIRIPQIDELPERLDD